MRFRPSLSVLIAFLTAAFASQAQSTTELPTLRADTHLVVEDVVVTDRSHKPVRNLKREDFALLESGAPQTLKNFEEHTPVASGLTTGMAAPPVMPPGVFTNITMTPANSAVNILLLDRLNTPLADQQYLHQQLLQFLKGVRPGTSIAIFGLSSRLVMLQGFTADPRVLLQAVEAEHGKASALLVERLGDSATQSLSSATPDLGSALDPNVSAALSFFDQQISTSSFEICSRLTLDSINILARYLASIPGRKNLVWFSGSFPVDLTAGIVSGSFSNPALDLPAG